MRRMKMLPKHVTSGTKLNYSFVAPQDTSSYKRKGSHSIEKYDPRSYLRKSSLARSKDNRTEPTSYEYQIRIRTASAYQVGQYKNMASKLTQYQPPMKLSEVPLTLRQQLVNDTSSKKETSKSYIEQTPKQNHTWAGYEKTNTQDRTAVHANTTLNELQEDSIFPSLSKLGKEKSRLKWRKLSKRTVFVFELDMVNDTVTLNRTRKPGVEEDVEEKVKVRTKFEGPNLSPHVQKKKAIEDRQRRPSIKVYYGVGNESPTKSLFPIDGTTGHEIRSLLLKNKLRDNLKIGMKVRKFLKKGPLETTFDLNRIDFTKMEPANYMTLYMAIKKAIAPTFYSTGNEEFNKVDAEMAELLQSKTQDEAGLTKYDSEVLNLYQAYLSQVETEKVMSGFWQVRKVYGHKPTCRESAGMATFEDKFYLFGGYGVDRMNDLWCLSSQNQGPGTAGYNWTLIRPLGSKAPEKRYAHCTASYNNEAYVFGGATDFLVGLKMRVTLGDLWKYSIEDNQWYEIDTSGTKHEKRMYAASCVMQGLWYIHGGTDGNNRNVLSSSLAYNFGITLHLTSKQLPIGRNGQVLRACVGGEDKVVRKDWPASNAYRDRSNAYMAHTTARQSKLLDEFS